jgi:DNA polymerase III subunit beta
MKLTTNNLMDALAITGAAVARTSTIPILDCVLIEAVDGRITITGSNLEMEIATSMPADIEEPGAICVHAGKLTHIVRNAPEGAIELKVDGDKLAIKTVRSRHRLNILNGSEYPLTEPPKDGATLTIQAQAFGRHIAHVEQCAAHDDVRGFLNGINIECDNSTLTFNASDGHRLGRSLLDLPDGPAETKASTILPKKAAQTIAKAIKAGDMQMTMTRDAVRIENERTTITCRCIADKFPDLGAMLSRRSDNCARIDADNLASTINRVESTTGEHFGIRLDIEPGQLTLTSVDTGDQESIATIECEYDGEPMTIGCNYKYLLDAAKGIAGTAILHLPDQEGNTDRGAIFIRPESDIYQYCIMPIRL